MGTDYAQQIIRNRMSKDVLLVKVSQLVQSLYLGILVIDDLWEASHNSSYEQCFVMGSKMTDSLILLFISANLLPITVTA